MCSSFSPQVTISIVSHGQVVLLQPLLEQLADIARHFPIQVVLTENTGSKHMGRFDVPELQIEYVANPEPKGFGANHNAAFARASAPYFCVMNPDIRLSGNPFESLLRQLHIAPGIAGPKVVNPAGGLEDSARYVPTLGRLLKRYVKGIRMADYKADHNQCVDWMAGMCLLFDAAAYRDLGGFDERFYLYCEDVDICLRAHLAGWQVNWVIDALVAHEARRDSRHKPRYLWWHLSSYIRLFCSSSYRDFRQR